LAQISILKKETYKRSTWKNGLGYTDQIAIYPADATLAQANFLFRLSSARIENASPFSLFPAHDRVLVILKGKGLKLTHTFEEGGEEEVVELPSFEPYEFPGDVPSRCDLIQGPITDFSLFVKRAEIQHLVEMIELGEDEQYEWSPEGRWNYALAVSGSFESESGALSEGDTFLLEHSSPLMGNRMTQFMSTSPSAKLLLISLA
jgi:environmental stress-induced protein Ves